MPKAVSKAQAALFGAIAGGKKTKATDMSPDSARKHLRGVKVSRLPARKNQRKERVQSTMKRYS